MEKSEIVKMLRQTRVGKYYDNENNELESRRISIHHSDGYDSPENRTWFFAVEGSPNKIVGTITCNVPKHKIVLPRGIRMITNHGDFFFSEDLKKISKRHYYEGH